MTISNKESMEESWERLRKEGDPCGFSFYPGDVQLRQMSLSDIDEVMVIEKASFSSPWSARFFLQELKVSCARALVAHLGAKIIGYVIYWLLPSEADIHNLAVHPAYRRRGVGRSLLQAVTEEARRIGLSRVTLEVRKSNDAAQQLYRSLGFAAQVERKGYYADNGEDALVMVLALEK